MLNFQNICSLDVLQLVLLWNFPGIKIFGIFFNYPFLLFSHHTPAQSVSLRGGSTTALKASSFSFAAHITFLTWYSLTLKLKQLFDFLFDLSVFQ